MSSLGLVFKEDWTLENTEGTEGESAQASGHVDARYKHSDLTDKIIRCAYQVHATLGCGFAEKVYENALAAELSDAGLSVVQQRPIEVCYNGRNVGDYLADVVVEEKVIVEVKAVSGIDRVHEVQLVNYLKATHIEVGLLLNFGRELQIKRKIFDQ